MTDTFVAEFLTTFDESRFPADFLQHYELMECLSHNEIGETLLVKDRQSGDCCVAKCYSSQLFLAETAESDLLKGFHHRGLPGYIGEYQNATMRCIVRQYAAGQSLDRLVQADLLTRQQSIAIAVQLCDILVYLHGQTPAVIHRDIKPQNIIVDDQGNVTLIDFGISRIYDETAQQDTYCFGTRHYAAPEQYGFSQTDCRSDIYSLGVLLCWLLTGKADVQQARKAIPDGRLVGIIDRCTAFAPKDRYRNASEVRDALTGRTPRRTVLALTFAALILLAAVVYFSSSGMLPFLKPVGVSFEEPLIEQAVRLALEKGPGEAISEQDLLSVTDIFVFGDQPAANAEAFRSYLDHFINNDGTVLRGSIRELDDLTKLKNLRNVSLCYQNIVDLTPLAELVDLEFVDLRHNPIEDVAPLSALTSLTTLSLFDTHVSDLTSLRSCPRLTSVDVGYTLVRSTAALEGLTSLQMLAIRRAPLQSLEKIDTLPMLELLYLSETRLLDLTPLLELPRLELVEVDTSMRTAADAIVDQARFAIVYP